MGSSIGARCDRLERALNRSISGLWVHGMEAEAEPEKFSWPLEVFSTSTKLQMLAEVRQARPDTLSEHESHTLDAAQFSPGLQEQMLAEIEAYQIRQGASCTTP
jgi:hypothetical protein